MSKLHEEMTNIRTYRTSIIACDIVYALFCVFAIYQLDEKPGIPPDIKSNFPSSELYSINNIEIPTEDAIEFVLSSLRIGDHVRLSLMDESRHRLELDAVLVPYYDIGSIVFDAFILLSLFALGIFVYVKQPREEASRIFHFATITLAAALSGTKTIHTIEPIWLGYFFLCLFLAAYTFLPAFFVHFTFIYPRNKWKNIKRKIGWVYAIAGILVVWQSTTLLIAASSRSMAWFDEYTRSSWSFYAFLFTAFPFGIATFIHSYRTSIESSEKKKLRWILFGLCLGPAPFMFLWVLPNLFFESSFVPEAIIKVFVMIIPLTFVISIIKYRIMDVDLIISRSTVYAIMLGVVIVLYLGVVSIAAEFVSDWTMNTSIIISSMTAVIIALLFEPLRNRVQQFVDKQFFRVRYNYREAQRKLFEHIRQTVGLQQLAALMVEQIDALLSIERIGFFTIHEPGYKLHLEAHKHFDLLEHHSIRLDLTTLKGRLKIPLVMEEKIEPGIVFEKADAAMFRRWGIAAIFSMTSEEGEILGYLVLGEKKSGMKFTAEDVDLVNTVVIQAGSAVQRIRLQQKLLLEHMETQRLDELNRLKSYFVSSVSHDLKTPLTSIKMFAEVLQSNKRLSSRKVRESLEIIEGETDKLTRLINNVLDFAKVERGVKEYYFSHVELNKIVQDALKMMQYQFKMSKCKVRSKLSPKKLAIKADEDAISEVLINLLSNALKYSRVKKEITISTFRQNGYATVQVADKGFGIDQKDLTNIFDPFYRADSNDHDIDGAGLGLSVVKHIMNAHGGRIEVESTLGKGSIFTLYFPMSINEKENVKKDSV